MKKPQKGALNLPESQQENGHGNATIETAIAEGKRAIIPPKQNRAELIDIILKREDAVTPKQLPEIMNFKPLPEKGRGIFAQTTQFGWFFCFRLCYIVVDGWSYAWKEGCV